MKAKHIISAVLLLALPFVLIIGFGALREYLSHMGARTFIFYYIILSMLAAGAPIVGYVFWLSYLMRTKNRPARVLLSCCSFCTATAIVLFIFFFKTPPHFISVISVSIVFANLFAGIYMLCKGRKGNIIADKRIHE